MSQIFPLHPPRTLTAAPPHDRKGACYAHRLIAYKKTKTACADGFSSSLPSVGGSRKRVVFLRNYNLDVIGKRFFMTFPSHPRPASVFPSAYCRAIHSAPILRVSRRGRWLQKVSKVPVFKECNYKKSLYYRLISLILEISPLHKISRFSVILSADQSHHFSCSRQAIVSSSNRLRITLIGFPPTM